MSRRSSLVKRLSSTFLSSSAEEKKDDENEGPTFLSNHLGPKVATILEQYADKIHDDSFLKIIRQLEFWHTHDGGSLLSEDEFLQLAERLAKIASWRVEVDDESIPDEKKFKIPKVRFGKTELQMPIITCGGKKRSCLYCILYLNHDISYHRYDEFISFLISFHIYMHVLIHNNIFQVCAYKKHGFLIQSLY